MQPSIIKTLRWGIIFDFPRTMLMVGCTFHTICVATSFVRKLLCGADTFEELMIGNLWLK